MEKTNMAFNPVRGEVYSIKVTYDQANRRWNPPTVFNSLTAQDELWFPANSRYYGGRLIMDPMIDRMDVYFIVRNAAKDIYRAKSAERPRLDEIDILIPIGEVERQDDGQTLVVSVRYVTRLKREQLQRYWGR